MRAMPLLIAPLVLTAACAATVPAKYDQAHILYNQAASVALAYAEQPDADAKTRIIVSSVISRTGPVVVKASQILDDPAKTKTEKQIYVEWATMVLDEAVSQLTDVVLGR